MWRVEHPCPVPLIYRIPFPLHERWSSSKQSKSFKRLSLFGVHIHLHPFQCLLDHHWLYFAIPSQLLDSHFCSIKVSIIEPMMLHLIKRHNSNFIGQRLKVSKPLVMNLLLNLIATLEGTSQLFLL